MQVSVVIVNYNSGSYLIRSVQSLLTQERINLVEVLIIDNGSSDGSLAETMAIDDPRIRIIELQDNLGFAHACNVGLQAARGGMILLFNPDARMEPGALEALCLALDNNPAADIAGPLLLNPDGTEQRGGRREIPSPWQVFCFILRLHKLMPQHPRFRNFNMAGQSIPPGPIKVQAISGSCMLVRVELLDRIGLMDAGYFMHFEDLEWCLRAQRAGRDILFVPSARVVHERGVSSRGHPWRVSWAKHRSLVRFLRRNFTGYYPSIFMLMLRVMVMTRFVWIAAKISMRRARGDDFIDLV